MAETAGVSTHLQLDSPVTAEQSQTAAVDLRELGFEEGGHILVKHGLSSITAGERLRVRGTAPELLMHLETWCRSRGDSVEPIHAEAGSSDSGPDRAIVADVIRGTVADSQWKGAEPTGTPDVQGVVDNPPGRWGVAARGALVEQGGPDFDFTLNTKAEVWSDELAALYRQAVGSQWNPFTAIAWDTPVNLPAEIEDAVVQLMTYLVENENAALLVPARFLGRLHPHFKEVMQLLAIQTADEARHVEVFTRRALLNRSKLGLSTAGGQASLKSLFDEPDFALAMFLLSVLGEGSFLALLSFVAENAPDPVTARVCFLASQDEARHVAFGMAHLLRHVEQDPGLRSRLQSAIVRRHSSLQETAGLNQEVFDALVVVAAKELAVKAIRTGYRKVLGLKEDMDAGRQRRLHKLGFRKEEARQLSELHTRNFM
jgi:hypothetical protein